MESVSTWQFFFAAIYLFFCFLVGRYSEQKGFPFARGFFLAILISPLLGALVLGFMKSKK
jgi:hypothetical protein